MKRLFILLAFAGSVAAQAPAPAPAPAEPKKDERPALNLKLDEPVRGAPRITFAPREGKAERQTDTLPALGGTPSHLLQRPIDPEQSGSPIPKDTMPGM